MRLLAAGTEVGSGFEGIVHSVLHHSAIVVGVIGTLVLLWGVLITLTILLRAEACRVQGQDPSAHQDRVRKTLAMYLLLGLELLVAADIIETIIAPDWSTVGVLGVIVAIRTLISVSINWELNQHVRREGASHG